jgi:hypothetical protein
VALRLRLPMQETRRGPLPETAENSWMRKCVAGDDAGRLNFESLVLALAFVENHGVDRARGETRFRAAVGIPAVHGERPARRSLEECRDDGPASGAGRRLHTV